MAHSLPLQVQQEIAANENGQPPVRRWDIHLYQLLHQRQDIGKNLSTKDLGILLHQGAQQLHRAYTERKFALYKIIQIHFLFVLLLLGKLCLGILAPLEGGTQVIQGYLGDMLQLLPGQHAWAGLLDAMRQAINTGFHVVCVGIFLLLLLLECGKRSLHELLNKLSKHASLSAFSGSAAQLAPCLERKGSDLFTHGEVKDWQQRLRSLRHKRGIQLAQFLHKGVDCLDGILYVLSLGSEEDHELWLAILTLHNGDVYLIVIFDVAFDLRIQLLGSNGELLQDARQDAGNELDKVCLHCPTNPLRGRHHVLLDRVVVG
mmetsp:Transcript_8120/g.18098  ORF Transcript_8120/g.18098 Transcript_8120/m.18098 type:complete len:317 (+) Transcript_8120:652-1602(+)